LPAGRPLLLGELPGQAPAPLVVLRPTAAGAALQFAFRLLNSSLGLLPAFPQLLSRSFVPAGSWSLRSSASWRGPTSLGRYEVRPGAFRPMLP
jgi:hypothetical protein